MGGRIRVGLGSFLFVDFLLKNSIFGKDETSEQSTHGIQESKKIKELRVDEIK